MKYQKRSGISLFELKVLFLQRLVQIKKYHPEFIKYNQLFINHLPPKNLIKNILKKFGN